VLVYGVVSAITGQAVELFRDRGEAEAFVAEVEQDEPDTAAVLSVEFDQAPNQPSGMCLSRPPWCDGLWPNRARQGHRHRLEATEGPALCGPGANALRGDREMPLAPSTLRD
jgi:hypothetical protein